MFKRTKILYMPPKVLHNLVDGFRLACNISISKARTGLAKGVKRNVVK